VHKKTIKRTFKGCNVGLKVKGKKWTNVLGFVELKAKKTKKQSTNEPK